MSIHLPRQDTLPPGTPSEDYSSSSDSDEDDQTYDDWVSDSENKRPTRSLFDKDLVLPSSAEALDHDKQKHSFELLVFSAELALDFHQRVRLINWIRKENPTVESVKSLKGSEALFSNDAYLIPVIEDDPLLQLQSDDWTDSEDETARDATPSAASQATSKEILAARRKVRALKEKLANSKRDLEQYRSMVEGKFDAVRAVVENSTEDAQKLPSRDDDSHYFQSYADNEIHWVMLQDNVRTSTYASFILSNPKLFRGAVVLDVGCGTGILSLFAARAGAKKVFAVDASDIAHKAENIIRNNKMDHIITVIRGKVEDITLPPEYPKVDVIISEWMGYALLYESMLDSVLVARDRFLRPGGALPTVTDKPVVDSLPGEVALPGGVMAPSQCKMVLALCDAETVIKERVTFWKDVYGFDMSPMSSEVYSDAMIDIIPPEAVYSTLATVKDLHLNTVTTSSLKFSAPFELQAAPPPKPVIPSTPASPLGSPSGTVHLPVRPPTPPKTGPTIKAKTAQAFVLWFDTFFTPNGLPVPPEARVKLVKDAVTGDVIQLTRRKSGKEDEKLRTKVESFSTGPESVPTHWKQTLFLLREPFEILPGTTVKGMFHCRKSDTNSRELDVEIHYSVEIDGKRTEETVVQMYKVR